MNITILLRHSGIWESEVKYNQYKSDGIVVGENISYMNLISAIATELDIDELKKKYYFLIYCRRQFFFDDN